jgi:hypothetical protein
MSITSTGIYGVNSTIVTSDLYEDIEQLKTNVATLTTSHLSTATNHDGRLDVLETDNTSNKERLDQLEESDTSNISRIGILEADNIDNKERLDDLAYDISTNKLSLEDRISIIEGSDAIDAILDVVPPIPAVPATGILALKAGLAAAAAGIATATAACIVNGVTAVSMIDSLELEVQQNKDTLDAKIDANNTSSNLLTLLDPLHFTNTDDKINIKTDFKPTTAGTADTAKLISSTDLLTSLNPLHFTNTDNKINIKTDFKPTTSGTADTAKLISSTDLLTSLNPLHFTNTDAKINIKPEFKPTTAGTADTAKLISSTDLLTSLNPLHFTDTDNKINIKSEFKPTTAGTADTAKLISSTDLLTSLNPLHFTNTDNKINIKSEFKPTTAGTADIAKLISSTDLLTSLNPLHFTDTDNKINIKSEFKPTTSGTADIAKLISSTNLLTSLNPLHFTDTDNKINIKSEFKPTTSGTADVANTANAISSTNLLPSLNPLHFTDTNNKINIKSDFKPTTAGTADIAKLISSTDLLTSLNPLHFTNTDNKINIKTDFKPTTSGTADIAKLISSTDLLTSLNPLHFTNTDNKINIKSDFKPTTAGTADTADTANAISSTNLLTSLNPNHFINNNQNQIELKTTLSATTLIPYFNSNEFLVHENKIKLFQLGYYTLEVVGSRGIPFLSNVNEAVVANHFSYYYTDRYSGTRYDIKNNIPSSVDGTSGGKTFLNYNAGDRIQFQVKIDGPTDWSYTDSSTGVTHYNRFGLWRIAINNPTGRTDWPKDPWFYTANPNEPYRTYNMDYYFEHLYSWAPEVDAIENFQDYMNITSVGKFNDKFIYTLEGGYVYYFTRRTYIPASITTWLPRVYALYENPIMIKVNDPIVPDSSSFIPKIVPSTITTEPVKKRRSLNVDIGVEKQISSTQYEVVNDPTTYELSTGFKYDEVNSKITVFDGNYDNLTNKPSIPAAQVQSDWSVTTGLGVILNKPSLFSGDYADLSGKPNLFSGSYTDLTNKPTIPAAQVNSDWNATTGLAQILNKPTIPVAQVSSDWNATTGLAQILNKPTIPAAQVQSNWTAISGLGVILNKPSLFSGSYADLTNIPATWTTSQIPELAISKISGLQGALAATQPKIISTAGQIIIGNGDGITTTSTGLTWTTNTLNATNLTTTNTLTTPNLAVSTQATITQLLTTTGGTLGTDMFSLINNSTNSLRFSQVYIGANDQKWLLIQKTNNVDNTIFNFRNGNIAVGTFSNPAYRIDLVGDINITGNYRVNGTIYKPANAVLADTATVATKLATARTIAGTSFDGTANINIDYFSLNNRPIILQPTTTNLQLVSGYTLSVPGNVRIGSTAIATNVLQVGTGARLRIANGPTDYTIIGTNDTDGATNTQIIISGNTRSSNAGNIQYVSTATNGSHLFYTTATSIRMTIANTGVNINNNLGVSGNIGVGTAPHATYKIDVVGDVNVSGVFRIGGVALTGGSKWTSSGNNIYYTTGNVGIGASTTSDIDDNPASGFVIPTARLYIRGGESAGGTCDVVIRGGVAGQAQGKARLWLMSDASHSSYIESHHIGNGFTNLTFGTAGGNVLPTERMKINYNGAVGIQTTGYAIPNNFMTSGSLTIGNQNQDYGGGNNWTANTAGLMMECLNNTEIVIHDAGHSLHSFMRYTHNGNFRIGRNMGYGVANLYITGGLICESFITAPSYILTNDAVYARNGYDTKIRSDSGGMFLEMGDIGNNNYLRLGAFNGNTEINSGANRSIIMRTGAVSWLFNAVGNAVNAYNSFYWSVVSDHRVKENIKKANLNICYDNVKNINLYRYNYIKGFRDTIPDKTQLGFVAQQVQQHFPKSVGRSKIRIEDKREVPDLASVSADQINFTLFGAVKQLIKVVEKQSKQIKKLEEMLGIIDDDIVEDDADEPYERIECDEVDIETIEPSEPEGV